MGALGQGGFRLGAWDGVEGGVSHGGTEGTEVMARMSRGFRRGAWGRFVSARASGSLLRLGRWP